MNALTLFAAATMAVSIEAAVAQHEGHQMPMAGQPQAAMDPAQCADGARQARDAAQAAVKRLEATRQNNDPAAMRMAVDDLQSALGFIQARLEVCTARPAAAQMPHTNAAPDTPMMQPGATTPASAAPAGGMAGMDHSKMNMPAAPAAPAPAKSAAPADGMAGMDHSKMNMPAEPAAKAPAKPAAPARGMAGMDHSKMGHAMAGMETAVPAGKVPVCKTPVDPKSAPKTDYKGKTYYFCSESDRQRFLANPEKYLKANPK